MRINKLLVLLIIGLSGVIIYQNLPTISKYFPSNSIPNTSTTSVQPTTIQPSSSIINITEQPTTVTFYPNQKQWFSVKEPLTWDGGFPKTFTTYSCYMVFDPMVSLFSALAPENRYFFLKTYRPIDQYYTQEGMYTGYYSSKKLQQITGPQISISVIDVTKDFLKVSIKASFPIK